MAALDADWSQFPPAQRAAFALARKLTYEPHHLTGADINALRKHYTDLQILEIIFSVAGNNSINRWKEGIGIPLEKDGSRFLRRPSNQPPKDRPLPIKSFLTPTSAAYKEKVSSVAPLLPGAKPSRTPVVRRPALESPAEVEKALQACRKRLPRLPLIEEAKVRALLPEDWPKGPLPQWVRLLANFPKHGRARILGLHAAEVQGDLKPLLRAQVSWILARQDRAWYALGEARRRLRQLGWSDERIAKLDGDWKEFSPAERALFRLARNLAGTPMVLTDRDVAEALELTGPREVVQLITYTTNRAFFHRVTEAAGLRLEE